MTNEVCKTFQNNSFKNTVKLCLYKFNIKIKKIVTITHLILAENCEGRVQIRKLISNPYLVLPCNRWRMQYNVSICAFSHTTRPNSVYSELTSQRLTVS